MPRGNRISEVQRDKVRMKFSLLKLDKATFMSQIGAMGNVPTINTFQDWVGGVRAFRPKQYQVDFYVNHSKLPNAIIQLFLGVSPAMISIVGTPRDVYRDTMATINRLNQASSGENQNIAINMALCLSTMGEIGYSQNNVPNFRRPSSMPEGNWDILKNKISDAITMGEAIWTAGQTTPSLYAQPNLASTINENAPEVAEVVEDDVFIDMDGEAQPTAPVVTSTTDPDQLVNLEIEAGSGITPSFVGVSNLGGVDEREDLSILVNKLRLALALKRKGWSLLFIKQTLNFIRLRGFRISSRRSSLDIKGRGTRTGLSDTFLTQGIESLVSATRFNSQTLINQIRGTFRGSPQYEAINNFYEFGVGSNLRNTRFTGRGDTLRGVIALPCALSEDADCKILNFPSVDDVKGKYEGILSSETGTTTTASAPTRNIDYGSAERNQRRGGTDASAQYDFYFLGYAHNESGALYQRQSQTLFYTPTIDPEPRRVYVFWLGKVGLDGKATAYQLQWGSIDNATIRTLKELEEYFKNNRERLSSEGVLKLHSVENDLQKILFSKSLSRVSSPAITYVRPIYKMGDGAKNFVLGIDKLEEDTTPFFQNALRLQMEADGAIEAERVAEEERQVRLRPLTKDDLISTSKSSLDELTFGWELELYLKQGNIRTLVSELNANNEAGALKFATGTNSMPVNGGQYGMVYDGSISKPSDSIGQRNRSDENFQGYDAKELVSPVLYGSKGIDLVTKCCTALMKSSVRINGSDGLHVHFDAHGRNPSKFKPKAWQIANMFINYTILQPIIDKYQSTPRTRKKVGGNWNQGVGWAKSFTDDEIVKLQAFSDAKNEDYMELYKDIYKGDRSVRTWKVGASREHYHGSRYRTVNIHSAVYDSGTIEFRQGSPSTDPLYINNWIKFCYYLIMASKKGYLKNTTDEAELWSYCEWMLPDEVASYIANATYMIDGRNVEKSFSRDFIVREDR